jgi:hypothetical protein
VIILAGGVSANIRPRAQDGGWDTIALFDTEDCHFEQSPFRLFQIWQVISDFAVSSARQYDRGNGVKLGDAGDARGKATAS